ncbi:MAG: hypothetical protein ABSB82_08055 [Terriglobia bacterium]|jgi:hypothetical protein
MAKKRRWSCLKEKEVEQTDAVQEAAVTSIGQGVSNMKEPRISVKEWDDEAQTSQP